MPTPVKIILVLVIAAGCLAIGITVGRHSAPSAAKAEEDAAASTEPSTAPTTSKAVASVRVVPIRHGELAPTMIAYGSVTAQPGEMAVLSVPYESRVGRVLATGGQPVSVGEQLLSVEPSPETQTQMIDAKNAVAAAERDLSAVRQRFESHLGTNAELSTAQQTLQNAQVKFASFVQRGASTTRSIAVQVAGIISKVDVQEGQIVPAGGPLMEIAIENRIAVKLGVQPEDVPNIRAGQDVVLHAVSGSRDNVIHGTVRLVTQRVNPDTRLVDVFVKLPADAGLVLEQYIRGELPAQAKQGFIVPRSAVLPEEDTHHLFTIKDGHAVEHKVNVELQTDKLALVSADDLHEGDVVVVVGNYELEDGMAVDVADAAASEPASTEASTTSPATTAEATTAPATTGATSNPATTESSPTTEAVK
jgi:RND family efflux transporter MFP subunit